MEITILSIADKGDLPNERIGLKVLKDCDLKYFLLFSTKLNPTGFYNRSKATFWFSPKQVKVNDRIIVYTKNGEDSIKHNDDGTTTYFLYWKLDQTIFDDEKHGVVLAQLSTWELSKGM